MLPPVTELERSDALGRKARLLFAARRSSHSWMMMPATTTPRKTSRTGMDKASNKGVFMRPMIAQRGPEARIAPA
ncbi:MAG TPA: hypothetical protein DCG66_06890 [Brevundimonas sp.]|nr:hypothetical protein [Brevundimonas sp.]HAF80725.1 hypothetical protein [Brevundimonas sp.]